MYKNSMDTGIKATYSRTNKLSIVTFQTSILRVTTDILTSKRTLYLRITQQFGSIISLDQNVFKQDLNLSQFLSEEQWSTKELHLGPDVKQFRIHYLTTKLVTSLTSLAVMVRMRSKSSTSSPNIGLSFGW